MAGYTTGVPGRLCLSETVLTISKGAEECRHVIRTFLRYVAVTSQSDASQAVVPSTEGQRSLAELLKKRSCRTGLS